MLVQCKCGQEVDVEIPRLVYAPDERKSYPTPIAGRKCPNPQCNKTIYIQTGVTITMADSQRIQDTKVNWYKSKIGDFIYFTGFTYEVAFKEIRNNVISSQPITVLYLRSLCGMDNMVVEAKMNKSPILMHINVSEPDLPWYETWTEDQLRKIMDKRVGL